jgi:hypothetical protein
MPAVPISLPFAWPQNDREGGLVKVSKTPRWLLGKPKTKDLFMKVGKRAKVMLHSINAKKGHDKVDQH